MLDLLKKKKLLEQLGVNKTQKHEAPNDVDQNKDVVKKASDTMRSMSMDSVNVGKNIPKEMAKHPLRHQVESSLGDESESLEEEKKELTLGEEPEEVKKKKMLHALFAKKKHGK